jgi:2TM domain
MNEHDKARAAMAQVEALTGFYIHAGVFALVMTLLVVINAGSGAEWWVQWPLLGWGAGLALHAILVFGRGPDVVRTWQLRKVHELTRKM